MSIPCKMNPLGGGVLPAGYRRLEYLKGTGTQYIDTGVTVSSSIEFNLRVELNVNRNNHAIFGGRTQWRYDEFVIGTDQKYGANRFRITYGNLENRLYSDYNSKINTLYDISFKNNVFTVKDLKDKSEFVGTIYHSAFSSKSTVYIFAMSNSNVIQDFPLQGKIYYVKFSKGDLKFNLIPCLSPTGVPGMYDIIQKQFFSNAGTGEFLYPGKKEEPATFSLRRPVMYAQLTPYGVRRLYHVPKGYNGTKEEYAAENGYKPIVEPEKPEEGYYTPHWKETDEEIILEWIEANPLKDIPS